MVKKENYDPKVYSINDDPVISELQSSSNDYAQKICRFYGINGDVVKMPNSTTNVVFLINDGQGKQVLKLSPYDRLYQGEVSFLERWHNIGLSVPGVFVKNSDKKIIPYNFFFMDYVDSTDDKIINSSRTTRLILLEKTISQLKDGHAIEEPTYGWINYHTDMSGDRDWNISLRNLIEGRGRALVAQGILSRKDIEKIATEISKMPNPAKCSLLHGDLRLENLLVTHNFNISIIDPDPIGGDGLYDVAYLSTSLEMRSQGNIPMLKKYLDSNPTDNDIWKWKLYKALAAIRQCSAVIKKAPSDNSKDIILHMRRLVDSAVG